MSEIDLAARDKNGHVIRVGDRVLVPHCMGETFNNTCGGHIVYKCNDDPISVPPSILISLTCYGDPITQAFKYRVVADTVCVLVSSLLTRSEDGRCEAVI